MASRRPAGQELVLDGADSAADVEEGPPVHAALPERFDEDPRRLQGPAALHSLQLGRGQALVEEALDSLALALAHDTVLTGHNVPRADLIVMPRPELHSVRLNTPITTVILDFGGVLGLPQDPVRAANMASMCRLPMEEFTAPVPARPPRAGPGNAVHRGVLGTDSQVAGVPPTPALIAAIEEEDSLGWTRINRRVVDWADELRSAGYATAILSNMPVDKLAYMRRMPAFDFIDDFPVRVFSCDHFMVKPEPEIYRLCLGLLGKPPAECLFLDDSLVNVEGGRVAGIAAVHFRSAAEAAPELSGKWKLPVRSLAG